MFFWWDGAGGGIIYKKKRNDALVAVVKQSEPCKARMKNTPKYKVARAVCCIQFVRITEGEIS